MRTAEHKGVLRAVADLQAVDRMTAAGGSLLRDRDQIRIVFGQLQSAGVHFIHGQKMVVGRDFVD